MVASGAEAGTPPVDSFFVGISAAAGCMAARHLDVFRIIFGRRNSLCLVLALALRGSLTPVPDTRTGKMLAQGADAGARRRAGCLSTLGEG
jgi:hypothetical protein